MQSHGKMIEANDSDLKDGCHDTGHHSHQTDEVVEMYTPHGHVIPDHSMAHLEHEFDAHDGDDPDLSVVSFDIAAETVVTTTNLPLHDTEINIISTQSETCDDVVCPSLLFDDVRNITGSDSSETDGNKLMSSDVITESELSALDICLEHSGTASQRPALNNNLQNVPYVTSDMSECDTQTALSLEDLTKRERARLLKQRLRRNPSFREKEKEQARARMRNKRNDPEYREKERRKDRERRKIVRHVNEEARQRERERDKVQKRLNRENVKELKQLHHHESLVGVADTLYVENCFVISDSSEQSYWTSEHVIGSNSDSIIQSDSRIDEEDVSLLPLDFVDKVTVDPSIG
ncbi:chromatin assembly factor 1 subunit A-like [Pecten maximus]|uniref:chromatin assembly factor 1 subunit A-like n=1 Tax=Pecten maximus TaxID=6579 RepID=UPI001458948C|nr:chromatin assembly factor 1 subunit A-like [Pecten maximus]XP_033727178.1 chromatin assembly factor 1 subunit A-like [Pecten maximus]